MTDFSPRANRVGLAVILIGIGLGTMACGSDEEMNRPVKNEAPPVGVPAFDPGTDCDFENGASEWKRNLVESDLRCEGFSESKSPAPDNGWTCYSDVTLNDDWHDDVLCRNGDQVLRPYLREWDDFVTEGEMTESADKFEAELNADG